MVFFSKKNILIPNVAEKNILILVEEKKNLIQSFCHIHEVPKYIPLRNIPSYYNTVHTIHR